MFLYYIEDHMQKFKPFCEIFFFHPNHHHLAWFCTHPFNAQASMSVVFQNEKQNLVYITECNDQLKTKP